MKLGRNAVLIDKDPDAIALLRKMETLVLE